jgi:hypothetical protein
LPSQGLLKAAIGRSDGGRGGPSLSEVVKLRAENDRLRIKLAQAEAIIDVQGKVHALLEQISKSAAPDDDCTNPSTPASTPSSPPASTARPPARRSAGHEPATNGAAAHPCGAAGTSPALPPLDRRHASPPAHPRRGSLRPRRHHPRQRHVVLDTAHRAHPERFRRPPNAPRIPEATWINQPEETPATTPAT